MGDMSAPIRTTTVPARGTDPASVPGPESLTPGGFTAATALPITGTAPVDKPQPLSLVASAQRLTAKKLKNRTSRTSSVDEGWQSDAWDMYDLVGEERFLANVLAGRGSQARMYVGKLSHTDPLAAPEPVEDERAQAVLDAIGVTSVGRSQIVLRALIGYFIAGETYLVGIPKRFLPDFDDGPQPGESFGPAATSRSYETSAPLETTLADLDWRAMSTDEVEIKNDKVKLKIAELGGGAIEVDPDDVYLVHSWRPHPRRAWEPDSPTRSSLPVLRELVGLTMAISGQTDSRLAGAGVFVVPESAAKVLKRAMGLPEDGPDDPFTDALIEAMMTPISDRSSAAAYVPLVIVAPDESADKFQHITFDKEFDAEMRPLRDEAIRRLALGQDAPPELLLGVGGMNHWGAWLVREDVITTHIEPPLALLCDAMTTQYLRPAVLAAGYSQENVDELVVWYDVSHLIARPNRSDDAQSIYDKGELSGEALRRESGFDESDAPAQIGQTDPAVDLALQLIAQAPSLMQNPGLPAVVEQIRAVQSGQAATAAAAEEGIGVEGGGDAEDATAPDRPADDAAPADGGPPSTSDAPAEPGGPEASAAALLAEAGAR